LRSLLLNSTPSDPERLRRRDAELEKLEDTVASAYAKFGDDTAAGAAGAGAAASAAPLNASLKKEIDLDLFGVDTPPPDLTHDILPADWVDLIWTSAFAAAAPPDYVALAAIVAAGGAIGNARAALAGPGWREAVVLWGALVGPPSAHKSPAMNDVRLALTRIDKKLYEQWRVACDKFEADHEIELAQTLKGQKKNVKKPAKPPLRQLLYDDVTLEKLTISIADNPHGALVFYDELAAWFSSFARYTADGDSSGARAFWNKTYQAGHHKRDRVKNEGPPIVIEAAACSVLGAIQPDRLQRFWKETNDGMLARLMLVWPRIAAAKAIDFAGDSGARDELAAKLRRAYQALYDLKLDQKDGEAQPKAIPLAAEAQTPFNAAYLECAEKTRSERGIFSEWLGKASGRILRLALVFEFMAWALEPTAAEPGEIGADAMARAIRYHDYLEAMFRRVMVGIEPSGAAGDALAIARLIVKQAWTHFADRDVGRTPGFRWFRDEQRGDKERRVNALKRLVDAGAVWRARVKTGRGFLEKWVVNPALPAALGR
jgi:uncharacterized protein DUF3987